MNVLIVDDEVNILEMIRQETPWETLGVDQVNTAGGVEEALRSVAQTMPDIILMDVEMPIMNGTALAEKIIKESDNPPEIVFLTGHSDYKYTRKAVQLGAADYVLKPFLVEELTAILSKVIIRCHEKNHVKQGEKSGTTEENQRYVMKSYLREVLEHTYDGDPQGLARAAELHGISFDVTVPYRMMAIGIAMEQGLRLYSKSELVFIFRNIAGEIMFGLEHPDDNLFMEYIVRDYYSAYLLIPEQEFNRQSIQEKCDRLSEVMKLYMHMQTMCVISEPIRVEQFAKKKDQIDIYLAHCVSYRSTLVFLDEVGEEQAFLEDAINQQEIVRFLRERKKSDLFIYMRHYLEQRERRMDGREMKRIHNDLMQVFYSFMYENRINANDFLKDEVSQNIQESAEYDSVSMMKYVSFMYDRIIQQIDKLKESETVIEKAKGYIEKHYKENIGRNDVADAVMLAPNYLSIVFHKETGKTLREYINLCRVDAAKQLMTTTGQSISDIALEVGFDNISYFSTIFKKYAGVTPVEFRQGSIK